MRQRFSLVLLVALALVATAPALAQSRANFSLTPPAPPVVSPFPQQVFVPGFGFQPVHNFPVGGFGFDAFHHHILHGNPGFFPGGFFPGGFFGGGFFGPNFAVGGFFPFPVASSSSSVVIIQQPAPVVVVEQLGGDPPGVPVAAGLPADWERVSVVASSYPRQHEPLAQLTLIVLKNETIYAATDYWLEDGRVFYVTSTGRQGSVPVRDLDWDMTTKLNAERGIDFVLHSAR